MNKNVFLSILMFLLTAATLLGFIIKNPKYWVIFDAGVIIITLITGILLLVDKKR